FHVTLPLPPGHEALAAPSRAAVLVDLPAMRVLAVDDVPQNLELLLVMLGRLGHQVVSAVDGQQAVALYRQQSFDVVLMDVQMAVMNGLEATRAIRALEREHGRAATPILALSASVLPEDRTVAIEAGMDGFATKPVDLPQLLAEIARVTGHTVANAPVTPEQATSDFLPFDPEVVDQKRALQRWGHKEAYGQALHKFVREKRRWLQDPAWEQAPGRPADCSAEAHRLKGVASNLGLSMLAAVCEQVEYRVRTGCLSRVPELWDALRGAVQLTVDELALGLESAGDPALPRAALAGHELVALLEVDDARQLALAVVEALRRGEPLERELHVAL